MGGRKKMVFSRDDIFHVQYLTNKGLTDPQIKQSVDLPIWAIKRISTEFWNEKFNNKKV